jgi:hypothetical protein
MSEFGCKTRVAEVPEVSRLELWNMFELERDSTVGEVPEVPRLERTMLSKDATVVELEAMMSQVQLRPRCPEKWREPKPRSPASAGCDAIPSVAMIAAGNIILRIASLPDRPQWRDYFGPVPLTRRAEHCSR